MLAGSTTLARQPWATYPSLGRQFGKAGSALIQARADWPPYRLRQFALRREARWAGRAAGPPSSVQELRVLSLGLGPLFGFRGDIHPSVFRFVAFHSDSFLTLIPTMLMGLEGSQMRLSGLTHHPPIYREVWEEAGVKDQSYFHFTGQKTEPLKVLKRLAKGHTVKLSG